MFLRAVENVDLSSVVTSVPLPVPRGSPSPCIFPPEARRQTFKHAPSASFPMRHKEKFDLTAATRPVSWFPNLTGCSLTL